MIKQKRLGGRSFLSAPAGIVLCLFLAIAAFFLWVEHRAYVLGALPWLLLAGCPLLHLFMHRSGHGGRRCPEHDGEAR